MSTIAYRDGVIAGDSGVWTGDAYFGSVQKVYKTVTRTKDKTLTGAFGFVGDLNAGLAFRDWFLVKSALEKFQDELPSFKEDDSFEALVVRAWGTVEIWDTNLIPYKVEAPFHAIGNGRDYAIGAMAAGATAIEAIEIACEFDAHTKGPIVSYDIKELNRRENK